MYHRVLHLLTHSLHTRRASDRGSRGERKIVDFSVFSWKTPTWALAGCNYDLFWQAGGAGYRSKIAYHSGLTRHGYAKGLGGGIPARQSSHVVRHRACPQVDAGPRPTAGTPDL